MNEVLTRRHASLLLLAGLAFPVAGRAAPSSSATNTAANDETKLARGCEFLRRNCTVDIHAHPGRFFAEDGPKTTLTDLFKPLSFTDRAVAEIRASGVGAVMISGVADLVLLGASPEGPRETRDYRRGEVWKDFRRQMTLMDRLRNIGLPLARTPADVREAYARGEARCFYAIEGGDFIENRLSRVRTAARRGVRSITLVHYRINQIGDVQTELPHYGGLSPFGKSVVRAMNREGLIVDLAHASFDATAQAAEVSDRPMMISHSNLAWPGATPHPRLLTVEHAKLVVEGGGIIGAVPANFGGLKSFTTYIDVIRRMIDALGIDHVSIGSDMDFTPGSVVPRYEYWPLLADALLTSGLEEEEAAKIMGGNFLRVLAAQQE